MSRNVPNDSAFPQAEPIRTEDAYDRNEPAYAKLSESIQSPNDTSARDWQIKLAKVNSAVSNFDSRARALNAKLEQSGFAVRFPNRLSISVHDTVDGIEATVKANVTVILTGRA